jgi:hypothetical protein
MNYFPIFHEFWHAYGAKNFQLSRTLPHLLNVTVVERIIKYSCFLSAGTHHCTTIIFSK